MTPLSFTSPADRPARVAPRAIAGRATSSRYRLVIVGWQMSPSDIRPATSIIRGFTPAV